ncbi:hypothetical protein G7Y89_g9222 [Cudoniella acicularis]|uniref:Uncharacterized protein n=1 Tax=Cudoniella acicularis TaxID=354080 RepID=A0A8H4RHD6_9HELO|nr:hypothetical protein G7Y89_g9222 [Cudoniella acicularis]
MKMESVQLAPSPVASSSYNDHSDSIVENHMITYPPTNSVWETVSRWLPFRNEDCDFWWQKTGPQLASLLLEAEYSISQQYEALLFHFHTVVPRLGPRPILLPSHAAPNPPKWKSFMTDDFGPIEYSWKWDSGAKQSTQVYSGPDVRYGMEPIGRYAGTTLDPLNQASAKEMLYQLNMAVPDIDLTWFLYLARVLFDPEETLEVQGEKKTEVTAVRTSTLFAFEFLRDRLSVKCYLIPRKPVHAKDTGSVDWNQFTTSIRNLSNLNDAQVKTNNWRAFDDMLSYLSTNEAGQRLSIFMIGFDCVKPSKSRMKIYLRSYMTSFDSVVSIMTMGGKLTGFEKNLSDLKELWRTTLGLSIDFNTSEDLPLPAHASSGMCYYFDIQQGNSLPDIKMYIPVGHFGVSDIGIARALTGFLEARGRGRYTRGYMRALEKLATRDRLEKSCGVQTYIACAFEGSGLSLTCYLSPNVYGPE